VAPAPMLFLSSISKFLVYYQAIEHMYYYQIQL